MEGLVTTHHFVTLSQALVRPVVTFVTIFGRTNRNEKIRVSRTYANGCNVSVEHDDIDDLPLQQMQDHQVVEEETRVTIPMQRRRI